MNDDNNEELEVLLFSYEKPKRFRGHCCPVCGTQELNPARNAYACGYRSMTDKVITPCMALLD